MGGITTTTENDIMIRRLKYLVDVSFYSLIPLVLLSLIIAKISNSLALLTIAMDYGLSFIVHLFAYQAIRTIQKSNIIKFPYGAGKLENFSGFLNGVFGIPISLYILYATLCRFLAPPESVSFSITQLALIPSLARSCYIFLHSKRLNRQADSPIVEAYYANFKAYMLFDTGILLAFAGAMVLTNMDYATVAFYIDPFISLLLALYLLYTGSKLTRDNFRILMDLPLPETEQIKIMNVLTREFDHYENIGNIYTRRSGRQRFLDIELYLKETTTIKETMHLQSRMQGHLEEYFDNITFHLIPLSHRRHEDKDMEYGKDSGRQK